MKRLLFALPALLAIFGFATPAFAETETETFHERGVTESFTDVICEGGTVYDITVTYNGVFHVTQTDAGYHETFTQAGRFEAIDMDTGEVVTGHFTIWGGFNENPGGEVNGTFTFSARGRGDLGSFINVHEVSHFDMTPTGTAHEFFKSNCD